MAVSFKALLISNQSWYSGNVAQLLQKSVLYIEPVDPSLWVGSLRKCEDAILPCLQVCCSALTYGILKHQNSSSVCSKLEIKLTNHCSSSLGSMVLVKRSNLKHHYEAKHKHLFIAMNKSEMVKGTIQR